MMGESKCPRAEHHNCRGLDNVKENVVVNDDTATNSHLTSDNHFAVVPEWVAYSPISANAVRVYIVLARHANATHTCFPSRRTIADKARISLSGVDRAIKELVSINALTVEKRFSHNKDRTSNLYTLIYRGVSSPVTRGGVTGDEGSSHPRLGVASELIQELEPYNENQRTKAKKKQTPSTFVDENFDRFWAIYPRKTGKGEARKAWLKAIVLATPDLIIAGVERYAPTRIGEDPKYTPLPTTWLNQQRWEDEPETPRPAGPQTRRQQNIQTMISIAQTTSPFQLERTNP